jgi:sulfate permease, SulP family
VRRALLTHGVGRSRAKYRETIARAIADIKAERQTSPPAVPDALAVT